VSRFSEGERNVYCPLCKAEYRAGFDRCSDCLISLVQTREQADTAKVSLLWEGTGQSKFNDIVEALMDANIPNQSRSGARPEKGLGFGSFGIVGMVMGAKRFHDQMSWQIFVLERDYGKAREIVENQI
jgi:hypothetical protein